MHIPKKLRTFNKRKDKREKWMTDELLLLVNQKNDMYVDWKTKSLSIEIYEIKKKNFRAFEKIVNIQKMKLRRIITTLFLPHIKIV